MRSARNLTYFFATFLLLASGPVPAQEAQAAEVTARLEALVPEAGAEEPVTVRFTLTNVTGRPITFLKWFTPLEGFDSDMFVVERDGRAVLYIGREVKRSAPGPEDYVTIEPGGSVSVELDLSEGYALSEPGQYRAQYRAQYRSRELTTNSVSFVLTEERPAPPLPQVGPVPRVTPEDVREGMTAAVPAFKNCSPDRITQLEEAHAKAGQIAGLAYLAIANTKEENRPDAPRYKEWFGAHTTARYAKVEDNFSKIFGALSKETITYDCDCDPEHKPDYAYVFPSKPFDIHLCNAFWRAPLEGTDSRSGTIVHETSHFNVVAGTDDHEYSQPACRTLAKNNPTVATDNADSHEYFTENNPELAMGLEHVALALLTIGLTLSADRLRRRCRARG
ncbi:MAG: peptidyl-Lys metalloendopeptidase [Acidobacteriota bacterium]|jgi:peptidyl-Lys metalloendopeptidase|nr:peptidyl-Lys metalloendopeptidase [Acidobacteriota bacterium]